MKYKFQVTVALTYKDEDIEAETDLSDEEVNTIKDLIASYKSKKEDPTNPEEYFPETSLLQILEQGNKGLFDKFWWDSICRPVFVKMLVNGIENGYIEKYPQDDFDYNNEDDFFDIQDMYSDDIDLEHSSCCICRFPEELRDIITTNKQDKTIF